MSRYAQNVIPLSFSGTVTGSDFSWKDGVLPFNTALELCGVSVSFPLGQLQRVVWCLVLHLSQPRLRQCFPQCPVGHNSFSLRNCLLTSIVLMTFHTSAQCFPLQKIRTGSRHYTNASSFLVIQLYPVRVHHLLCVFSTSVEGRLFLFIPVLSTLVSSHYDIGLHL